MEDLVVDLGMRFQLLLAFLKDNLPRSSVPVHIELLLAFALWTLSLVGISVGYRVIASMTGAERADAWRRGQPPNPRDPGFVVRAGEAHQNCLETLPVLTAVVFASHALARSSVIAPLAQVFGFIPPRFTVFHCEFDSSSLCCALLKVLLTLLG